MRRPQKRTDDTALTRGSEAKRDRLLEAAAVLILERGVTHVTLDAVREAAGISKGGLLYYFGSKAALLEALVDMLMERFVGEVQDRVADNTHSRAPLAHAYLETVANIGDSPLQQQTCKALSAICMTHPELLPKVRAHLACISLDSEPAGTDPLYSMQLRLLADGLWLADLFNHHGTDLTRRAALLQYVSRGEPRESCGED
jgi:AcrR family transcriptional regulator